MTVIFNIGSVQWRITYVAVGTLLLSRLNVFFSHGMKIGWRSRVVPDVNVLQLLVRRTKLQCYDPQFIKITIILTSLPHAR